MADTVQPLADTFLARIAERRLCIARRRTTGEALHYAMHLPAEDVQWQDASGLATLWSYTVLWQAYRAQMKVPYNVAWVQLDEGPRLMSTVAVEDQVLLAVGMRLRARFTDEGLLVFDPYQETLP